MYENKNYRVNRKIEDEEFIKDMNEALSLGPDAFIFVLTLMVLKYGLEEISSRTGLETSKIHKILEPYQKPGFKHIFRIIKSLGLQITLSKAEKASDTV